MTSGTATKWPRKEAVPLGIVSATTAAGKLFSGGSPCSSCHSRLCGRPHR